MMAAMRLQYADLSRHFERPAISIGLLLSVWPCLHDVHRAVGRRDRLAKKVEWPIAGLIHTFIGRCCEPTPLIELTLVT